MFKIPVQVDEVNIYQSGPNRFELEFDGPSACLVRTYTRLRDAKRGLRRILDRVGMSDYMVPVDYFPRIDRPPIPKISFYV